MKKIILLSAIVLSGCGSYTPPTEETKLETRESDDISVWIDKDTGCEYLVFMDYAGQGAAGGITPRMELDGSQVCYPQ